MQAEDYKAWLEKSGASENSRATRAYALTTIEKNLNTLGFEFEDLDDLVRNGDLDELRGRLRKMREDAKAGGNDFRILMPDSEKPLSRLSSWGSWLAQYGRFLSGDPPRLANDADRIRQYVLDEYIEPAREVGDPYAEIRVSDVNEGLGLSEAWPNICQTLRGRKFLELAELNTPVQIGKDQSSATVFRFSLDGALIDRVALDQMRALFLRTSPDFESFLSPGEGWAKDEKEYKVVASDKVRDAIDNNADDAALGAAVFQVLKSAAKESPFVRWQTEDRIAKQTPELLNEFYAVIGRLVRSAAPVKERLVEFETAFLDLKLRGAASLTYGERINIATSALAMVRPDRIAPLKITRINEAWQSLTGERLFVEARADMAADYDRFATLFEQLFQIMRDDWQWAPQDWLDLQGFLWIANEAAQNSDETLPTPTDLTDTSEGRPMKPVNLILYGPPGTGKTYRTAEKALELCGEEVPEDRTALMEAYNRLQQTGQIEFVTFHQSMSYEDFIEGRQPVTDAGEEEDGPASAGFRLETRPGIFRRIAKRAETSRGRVHGAEAISLQGRRVFKMSIGEASNPEDAQFFEEAIAGGYALLGFDDIDWSDRKFEGKDAVIEAVRALGPSNAEADARTGAVQMPFIFRNWVQKGDIVIVSKGNSVFRAIGEFTGDYEFHPRPGGTFAHRRSVRWLWMDREGLPVSEVYSRSFTQKSIYLLLDNELNIPVLERLMNSRQDERVAEPEQFVLIIDEINRANISKVFGELITLLEPDKRLGQQNELRLRLPYSGEEDFGVPSNLHIIGTMNTADRSIALLDTALRRRFTFEEMMPSPQALEDAKAATGLDLPRLLATLNTRIEYLYDREHQIGHAYFISCGTRADVDEVMRHKVIPLLAEYFFEDWGKVAAVLGDAVSHDQEINGGFLNRTVLSPPRGFEDGDGLPRFRWSVRPDEFDYSRLLEI